MEEEQIEPVRLSKNYTNNEILFIYPNGDIHLKPGVHRLKYQTHLDPYILEEHVNDIDIRVQRTRTRTNELFNKYDNGEVREY